MNVVEIRLNNIMCFDEKTIRLGRRTHVTGKNGAGKSTIAESLKSVIGGGSDVTLLRAGSEEGEIALLLDDGMEIVKRFTAKGASVTVKHPVYGKISKPQTVIESLAMIASVNPVAFLSMPEKKRAEFLLDVCPIEVSADEIETIIAPAGLTLGADGLADFEGGLDAIAGAREFVYDRRTAVNGVIKEKRGTIAQLGASLPEDRSELDRDISSEIEAKLAERATIVDGAEARIANVSDTWLVELQRRNARKTERLEQAAARRHAEIRTIEEQIETLRRELAVKRSELDAELAQIASEEDAARESYINELDGKKQAIRDEALPKVAALDSEIAVLREAERHAERYRLTASQVEQNVADVERLEAESVLFTAAIEGLDALKREKLETLPIPGIEIRDGVIHRDDVPFDRLNTAQRVGIAFDLAILRSGQLPFVFVDGAECLDAESQAELDRRADEAGVQFLTFAVSDGPLEIITDDAEVPA